MYAIIEINQGYVERDVVICSSIEAVRLHISSEYKEYGNAYFNCYFQEQLKVPQEDVDAYFSFYSVTEDETDLLIRIRGIDGNKIYNTTSMLEKVFDNTL